MGVETDSTRVPILLDNETGLNYIRGKTVNLFENGVTVDRAAYERRSITKRTTSSLIIEAMKDPKNCDWDFRKACATTNLTAKAKGAKRVLVPNAQASTVKGRKEVEPVIHETVKTEISKRVSKAKEFFSAPHADIVVISTIIGIACAFMSMYHAFVFLHDVNGKPSPVAFITAFTMVLFAASAFTIARHLGADRKIGFMSRLVLAPTFVALGVGVVWFLVFSTVTVNYEQFRARDLAKEEQFVAKDTRVTTVNTAITTKDTDIANAVKDVERYTRESDKWYAEYSKPLPNEAPSEDPAVQRQIDSRRYAATTARNKALKFYETAQADLKRATDKRDRLMGEKSALIDKSDIVTTTAKESRETAYSVVASKTGIAESTLKFLVYVIPPTFFDIVSPVTLSVVLLLRDRRRVKDEAEKKSLGSRISDWLKKKLKEE